jgi:uncharacterized protein YegL
MKRLLFVIGLTSLIGLAVLLTGCEGNAPAVSARTVAAIETNNAHVNTAVGITAIAKTPMALAPTGTPPGTAAITTAVPATAEMLALIKTATPTAMPTTTATPAPAMMSTARMTMTAPGEATLAAMPTTAPPDRTRIPPSATRVSDLKPTQPVPELKAGEIDDNKLWDEYLQYRVEALKQRFRFHDVDISERYTIQVFTGQQMPVLGARVSIYSDQTLVSDTYTYSNGQTLFFPKTLPNNVNMQSFEVVVEKDGQSGRQTFQRNERATWLVTLDQLSLATDRPKLDVVFLLDATGSMGDEIAQLQGNILSISSQIDTLPSQPDTHYGMVTYRDRGDQFITKIYPFTPDVKTFQASLNSVVANNGGDEPEALNASLHDAVHGLEWRGDDTVKLVFLVSDAPPHLDYGDDFDYAKEMVDATQQGIKVYSLAASGLDAQGEYIFRQIAQYTMGHFIFLTYERPAPSQGQQPVDSKPGENTGMSVPKSSYTVELLDQLVVRLITEELANLSKQ